MRGCDAAAAVTMLVRASAKAAGRHGDDEYDEELADKRKRLMLYACLPRNPIEKKSR